MCLGHESAGTVVQVGAAVTGLKVGDRVALEPGVGCGTCDLCREGRYEVSPSQSAAHYSFVQP
jgi:threonine dehydrogenase-like Zn-dependent dehydrogenase